VRPFAVAGIQMEVRPYLGDLDAFERRLDHLMANFPWVQMVLLSELSLRGPGLGSAEPMPGPTESELRRMASKHGIWLVPGSLYEKDGDRIYNTTPVIDPGGQVVGRHRKLFPFEPYETGVTPGTEPLVFDVPSVGRFGVSICYDMWFPETSRWLVALGAEVILRPALTDTIDREIELAMVRAAAAQNQCYVLDVNGLVDGGIGRSIFVGPAGDVLHEAGTHPEEIAFEIDLDRVTRSREVGLRGLGQPLKSYRDRPFDFPHYEPGYRSEALEALGRLKKPERGSRAGLDGRARTDRGESEER